ncbi:ExbD/TolR family protein [Botryobacter ruber]|uniref:ExbD/TolR family protein n=1 Tax=Botryobacter ruber TaxID=2171629 RepID=UPI000E0A2E46|nr:biopolymer transporter ExbD [Botryobacter ruber]
MAQLQEKPESGKGGKRRARKLNTHLDMTPMVDLAFLLLTFFMLTTTFSKLAAMELQMPADTKVTTPVPARNALTIVLGENDRIYYFFGFPGDAPAVTTTDFSAEGLRKLLLSEKVKSNQKQVVLLKAMKESKYRNLVDALDEMRITGTKKYALADLEAADRELLEKHKGKFEAL